MKALSIRQPWAWAILNAGKRIENRSWSGCHYRGPLLIHAAKGCGAEECLDAITWMVGAGLLVGDAYHAWPGRQRVDLGGIVGVCNVVDVINRGSYASRAYPADPAQRIESPWYTGELGLVLADVRPLPFVPLKGALGFFEVPDDLVPEAFR